MIETCPDYHDDFIFLKGEKRKICGFWDLDNPGICNHENHNVCIFYLNKKGINDKWLRDFMEGFGCVLI